MNRFKTAEELMDHLKKQIISYSNKEPFEEQELSGKSTEGFQTDAISLSALNYEREANNALWNVSAERPITSHRKVTGKFIVFGKKVVRKFLRWYVSNTFDLQSAFNGSVTRSINEVSNILINIKGVISSLEDQLYTQQTRQAEIEKKVNKIQEELHTMMKQNQQSLDGKLKEFENRVHLLEQKSQEQTEKLLHAENISKEHNSMLRNEISSLYNAVQELGEKTKNTQVLSQDGIGELKNSFQDLVDYVQQLSAKQHEQRGELNVLHHRVRKMKKDSLLDNRNFKSLNEVAVASEKTEEEIDGNFDYLLFENRFRGSVEDIKSRQTYYLPYFEGKRNILDIGCGRGEFVELLLERNITVRGIDLNQEMVEYCKERGLPVERHDAVQYLGSVEDNSLGGIFLSQVIEHMPFEQVVSVVNLAYQKLQFGAYLIMETPNPQTLAIFNRFFYVDPTHVKPVHPYTIHYVVESAGFQHIDFYFSGAVESKDKIPQLVSSNGSIENIEEFNKAIHRLNDTLYGNQDYAIIAKK